MIITVNDHDARVTAEEEVVANITSQDLSRCLTENQVISIAATTVYVNYSQDASSAVAAAADGSEKRSGKKNGTFPKLKENNRKSSPCRLQFTTVAGKSWLVT